MDKKTFALLAVAAAMASCSSDMDDTYDTPDQPQRLRSCTAVVDFTVPNPADAAQANPSSGTQGPRRATAETADRDSLSLALPDEYRVNSVVLYLYSAQSGNLADTIHVARLTKADSQGNGNIRLKGDSIRLEPGEYRVYAVANAPKAAADFSSERALMESVAGTRAIMSVIPAEGIVMTSRGGMTETVRVATDSVTHIEIPLERSVAKVELGKRLGSYELRDKDGKVYASVTPGSFYFVNLSRDYYLFRHTGQFAKDATPEASAYQWSASHFAAIPDNDGYLVDPHFFEKRWDKSGAFDGATIFDNALTEILRTGREYEATLFPEAGKYSKSYILENASFWTAQREGYCTGIIIKSTLTPVTSRCFDETGANVDPQSVRGLYYFNYNFYTSLAAANAIGGANVPAGTTDYAELEERYNIKYFAIDDKSLYPCYYKHFIKHLDNGDPKRLGVMEYGVVRNNWYRVTIADIAGLGHGEVHVEPTRPVEEDDVLLTDYYVSPWQYRPDDTVLTRGKNNQAE